MPAYRQSLARLVKRVLDRDVSFLGWPCNVSFLEIAFQGCPQVLQRRDLCVSIFKRGQMGNDHRPARHKTSAKRTGRLLPFAWTLKLLPGFGQQRGPKLALAVRRIG